MQATRWSLTFGCHRITFARPAGLMLPFCRKLSKYYLLHMCVYICRCFDEDCHILPRLVATIFLLCLWVQALSRG